MNETVITGLIVAGCVTLMFTLIGWFIKWTIQAAKEGIDQRSEDNRKANEKNTQDIHTLEVKMATEYVSKNDFREALNEMKNDLNGSVNEVKEAVEKLRDDIHEIIKESK